MKYISVPSFAALATLILAIHSPVSASEADSAENPNCRLVEVAREGFPPLMVMSFQKTFIEAESAEDCIDRAERLLGGTLRCSITWVSTESGIPTISSETTIDCRVRRVKFKFEDRTRGVIVRGVVKRGRVDSTSVAESASSAAE